MDMDGDDNKILKRSKVKHIYHKIHKDEAKSFAKSQGFEYYTK